MKQKKHTKLLVTMAMGISLLPQLKNEISSVEALKPLNQNEQYETTKTAKTTKVAIKNWIIEGGVQDVDWEFNDKVLTIKSDGEYHIDGQGIKVNDRIIIPENFKGTLYLKNVNIESDDFNNAAINVDGTANLTIMLEGDNVLIGNTEAAAIQFNKADSGTGKLIIDSKSKGSLYTHSRNGAGIGGYTGKATGKIIINGGNIEASSTHGTGIGPGAWFESYGTHIIINGGTVKAYSLGGGNSIVEIHGGNVTANVYGNANTILKADGGSYTGDVNGSAIVDGGNIVINKIENGTIKNSSGEELIAVKVPLIKESVDSVSLDDKDVNISGSYTNKSINLYIPKKEDVVYKLVVTDADQNTYEYTIKVENTTAIVTLQNKWIETLKIDSITYGKTLNPTATPLIGAVEFTYSDQK